MHAADVYPSLSKLLVDGHTLLLSAVEQCSLLTAEADAECALLDDKLGS